MTFGIFAMVLVGFSWIVWGYVAGKAPQKNSDMGSIVMICAALSALITLPVALVQGIPQAPPSAVWLVLGVIFFGGICNFAQLHWMSLAMQKGPNGIIWSMAQSGFVFPFFIGIIFYNVPFTLWRMVGILLIFVSLVIFAIFSDNSASGKWKLLAIMTFLATGACNSMSNLPSYFKYIDQVSSVWRTLAFFCGMCSGFLVFACFDREHFRKLNTALRNKFTWGFALLIDGVEVLVHFFLLYPGMDALAKADAGAISNPIMVASSIVLFELYAIVLLREKRNMLQIAALAFCLAAVVAFCF